MSGGQTDVGTKFLPVVISQQVIFLQKSGEILYLLMFVPCGIGWNLFQLLTTTSDEIVQKKQVQQIIDHNSTTVTSQHCKILHFIYSKTSSHRKSLLS